MRFKIVAFAVMFLVIGSITAAPTYAQGQPLELPCVTGVTVQPIGQAMPEDASGQALVMLRLTIEAGGGFEAHTHPGTLVVSIESGALDYTMLDDMEQSIMRGPSEGTPAASEAVTKNVPVTLNPGDWFVEPRGMVHSAANSGSEPTIVLLTGLVDPNAPFVQCVTEGTPTS